MTLSRQVSRFSFAIAIPCQLRSSETGRGEGVAFLIAFFMCPVAFLENLSVKDSAEKDQFFRKLPNILLSFPQPVQVQKVGAAEG